MDLHTHLDLYPNALGIIDKVNTENKFTLAVTTSPRAWLATRKVFSKYKNIYVALGLHPEIALEKINELELLLNYIPQAKFIGELGIDGSERYAQTYSVQELVFNQAIQKCQSSGGRIISIHSRNAVDKVLSILNNFPDCGIPILHWFSGSKEQLKIAVDMKCYFSINPLMSKSKNGKELISLIPPKLILPESDGPFATQRGKPIMPWEAMNICNDLSSIWNLSSNEVKNQIENNLRNLLSHEL